MVFEPATRLNIVTGDNGLGKSFLLDLAWWAVTRTWAGEPIRPPLENPAPAKVQIEFAAVSKTARMNVTFERSEQEWRFPPGKPGQPGLVVYARVDGDFAVWDSSRRFGDREEVETGVPKGLVFTREQVWNGLQIKGKPICNGLISDWVSWQQTGTWEFDALRHTLNALSPSPEELVQMGDPARTDILDSRLIPTLRMPYGQDVPVNVASAGMKRVIALAYLLVWAWREHLAVSRLAGRATTKRMLVIIDEVESHLHPKWQRVILSALVDSLTRLTGHEKPQIQYIVATHSPLVLASIEQLFDGLKDALFELTLTPRGTVELSEADFRKQGSADSWLTSDAFGLSSSRSREAEQAIERAAELIKTGAAEGSSSIDAMEVELSHILPDTDPFWVRWRAALAGFRSPA